MKQCVIYLFLYVAIVSCNTQNTVINIENFTIMCKTAETDYKCTSDIEYIVLAEKQVNWFKAQQMCEENGMELATVSNDAENERLRLVLEKNLPSGYAWISGVKTELNGDYTWMRSTKKVTFTKWASGYPMADVNSLCLCVGRDVQWYNYYCHTNYYPVCQQSCQRSLTKYLNKIIK